MNKFLSHCIIQILIIVLGLLGVAQALPGSCLTDCLCHQPRGDIAAQSPCCNVKGAQSGNPQWAATDGNCSQFSGPPFPDVGQPQKHALAGMAADRHEGAKASADCQYKAICSANTGTAAYNLRLATTGKQANSDIDLSGIEDAPLVHDVADFSTESEEARPFQAPILTPPLIYTRNCVFLI